MFEPLFAHFGPLSSAVLLLSVLLLAVASPVRHVIVTSRLPARVRGCVRRLSPLNSLP